MLRAFLTCVVVALSTVPRASEEKLPAHAGSALRSPDPIGSAASFAWSDADGDGRLDLALVGAAGELRLLRNAADGGFRDVTGDVGLGAVTDAGLVLWADYDGDGRSDLFVGARAGASRLFRNEGGVFVDVSAACGLACAGTVRSAHALDEDGDGRLDLFVVTDEHGWLFRGRTGGFFEERELPGVPGFVRGPIDAGSELDLAERDIHARRPAGSAGAREERTANEGAPLDVSRTDDGARPSSERLGPAPGVDSFAPLLGFPGDCADGLRDQANPGACLAASTTPTLGQLHPLSEDLFVAADGKVGIGTTSPAATLHVAGAARIGGTLTLAPAGDQALDVAAGSLFKSGALFIHTKGGTGNTGLGREALRSVSSGSYNTASGYRALYSNTQGTSNTATGFRALFSNFGGSRNTGIGARALFSNTTGINNTASGFRALLSNTTGGNNTASGYRALFANTTASGNTACGAQSLAANSVGSDNTASGYAALGSNTTGANNSAVGARALFANTTGSNNTASGHRALHSNTTGTGNSASGVDALLANTVGVDNTASGFQTLSANTAGSRNTASGFQALLANTTGSYNTASGFLALAANIAGENNAALGNSALRFSTGHGNTAMGAGALSQITSGGGNIALGYEAGSYMTTGTNNIAIGNPGVGSESSTIRIGKSGTHTKTFLAGVRNVTTTFNNAIPVLIDGFGQLGTISSSRRFKEEIRDMGDATERLLELRPVVFRYKPEVQTGERSLEYGLIAEEVAEVFPDLVVRDDEGQPFTVKYHLLSSMLLNELKKQARELEDLRGELARLHGLETRLAALESGAARPGNR